MRSNDTGILGRYHLEKHRLLRSTEWPLCPWCPTVQSLREDKLLGYSGGCYSLVQPFSLLYRPMLCVAQVHTWHCRARWIHWHGQWFPILGYPPAGLPVILSHDRTQATSLNSTGIIFSLRGNWLKSRSIHKMCEDRPPKQVVPR